MYDDHLRQTSFIVVVNIVASAHQFRNSFQQSKPACAHSSPAMAPVIASIVLPSEQAAGKGQPVERLEHHAGFYEVPANEVHPLHAAAKPSQDALKSSPSHPVIVTPNPMVKQQVGCGTLAAGKVRNSLGADMSSHSNTVASKRLPNGQAAARTSASSARSLTALVATHSITF